MSEKTGPESSSSSPFSAFTAAFPGATPDAWQKMWSMFTPPMPGSAPGAPMGAMAPSLSMMSEMIAPLTNLAELDKRITDLRAVEHWLKLNLQMLQSTTQALEVQRATLATLRAFGAAMPGGTAQADTKASPAEAAGGFAGSFASDAMPGIPGMPGMPPGVASLDPTVWWEAINEQFKQLSAAAAAATAAAMPSAAGASKTASNAATAAAQKAPPTDTARPAARKTTGVKRAKQ